MDKATLINIRKLYYNKEILTAVDLGPNLEGGRGGILVWNIAVQEMKI